ncbi:GTP-binding protein [Alcaligenaceae bacterium CGII-47]|nr:GTP-binding protein [Alcaligenaceae bacterium CGII-47]
MTPAPLTDRRIPINVLTGFLGSGKTSLLRRLLHSDTLAHCAVLINELGEVGLDYELLDHIDQETVVLQNGCICCGIRDDLERALLSLHERRDQGILPPFDRVIIETTGLADPVPVLNTVIIDPILRHHFRIGTVVATVDSVNGLWQLKNQPESVKQAAIADRLVLTKADLVDASQVDALRTALIRINPTARLLVSHNDAGAADVLMEQDTSAASRQDEVLQWFYHSPEKSFNTARTEPLFGAAGRRLGPVHRAGISTVSLVFEQPLDWIAFGVWFSMLLHSHGDRILRIKGILDIAGSERPTVVHGVQHLMHPPSHLNTWPSSDRRSRLVLIGHLPPRDDLLESLELFGMPAHLLQDTAVS